MELIQAYKASDGTLFDNAIDAKKHEARVGIEAMRPVGHLGESSVWVMDWLLENHARIGELLSAIGRTDNKPVFQPVQRAVREAYLTQNGTDK